MTDPGWGPIGREVFDRTYSRTKADGTKESFDEVVARMVDGNLALTKSETQLPGERDRLVELVSSFKLVPAGRHWWVSGVPGRQFLFNCHRAGWTDQLADHVGFTFDELMKGGGVGSNYSSDYMARMLPVSRGVEVLAYVHSSHPDATEVGVAAPDRESGLPSMDMIQVPDTREGWVHALGHLGPTAQLEGPDTVVVYDVSDVRPRGSRINGFGGTACGPGPLVEMLVGIAEVINRAAGRRLTPIEAMEIDHAVARCVVAGNVRRSSRMSMMHWQDPDIERFIELKRNGGHWTTNISVETDTRFWREARSGTSRARFLLDMIAEGMLANGEPGIFNATKAAEGEERDVRCTNPCGEIALEEWEQCNLGHLNLARISRDEIDECLELMTRWLIRATFGDGCTFRQRQVVDRNRRIGVGIMGYQEWLYDRFHTKYSMVFDQHPAEVELARMKFQVRIVADMFAKELGIPAPIKTTTVAPTGTVAKMAGATEGIHPVYSRYFVRRVRYADDDPALVELTARGLHIEPDLMSPRTAVVSFPCRDAALDRVHEEYLEQSDELSLQAMLMQLKLVQTNWADNAVSYTINLRRESTTANLLANALMTHGPSLKGVTVMPEGSYLQAPMERITGFEYDELRLSGVQTETGSSALECEGACPIR